MIIKYTLTKHAQIRQMRFEIKNKLTILTWYLKLFFTLSFDINLFYQTWLIYLMT